MTSILLSIIIVVTAVTKCQGTIFGVSFSTLGREVFTIFVKHKLQYKWIWGPQDLPSQVLCLE